MKPEQLRNRILAADLAWIPVALAAEQALCSCLHWSPHSLGPFNFVVYVVCTVFAWVLLSENMHLDGFREGWRLSTLVSHLLLATLLLTVLLLAVENVSEKFVGKLTLSVFSLLLLMGFLGIRVLALRNVLRRYKSGNIHRVVILGSDRLATELAAKFNYHPELLCKVVGFLNPESDIPVTRRRDDVAVPSTVSTMDVISVLRQHNVDELVLAQNPVSNELLNLVALCRQQAIRVSLVPQPYELYLSRPRLLDVGGLPLLQLGHALPLASEGISKRVLDLSIGFALAVATLPILLICGVALRISTGQALRWEIRIGRLGAQFFMPRLNVDRYPQGGSAFERLLCRVSISELPQLWNVLRGDMSLVGPRPESPERANLYSSWQQQRLSVKPGMTGLAQVRGLREQHTSEDKTRHDLQYMLHPSLLKDLSILIETIWTLTLRLIDLPLRTFPGGAADGGKPPSMEYSPSSQIFPEILQHAHRTQSGSD
jgi:lipopolysaccharide/colanic/teichoic acid biosynthesis glycosyltransferase